MNETIKEGDFVEYLGRPNEKFLVEKDTSIYNFYFPYKIAIGKDDIYFYGNGCLLKNDTNPIVKKTTPPKKKVLKEFFGKMSYNNDLSSFTTGPVLSANICQTINPRDFEAKIIIEVEE